MALQEILQNMQGFQNLAANQQQMQQQAMQQTQQREAADFLRKYQQSEASGKPDYMHLQEAVLRSPDLAQNYLSALGLRDKKTAQQMADDVVTMYSALGNKDQFNQVAARRVDAIMQRGGNPDDTLELVQIYNEKGPEAARQTLQITGAAFANQGLIKPELVGIGQRESAITPYQQAQLDLRGREVAAAEKRASRPDTQVTVQNSQENEIARLSAKEYQDIIAKAAAANKELATIGSLEKLSDKAFSGTGAGTLLAGAKMLNQLGIETEGLKETEVYDKLANTLVLDKSQQLSGAISNADMTFLQNTVPSLNTTKEGRKLTFDISRKLAEREKQVARLATEFRKRNGGRFDSGEFQAYLDEWKESNPLFEGSQNNTDAGTPASVKVGRFVVETQ